MSAGMWQWLAEGDAVTWATAALMLLMSVLSWVVILYKLWFMAVARRSVPQAVAAFWQMPDLVQAMAQVKALDRQGLVQAMADALGQGAMAAQGSLAQSAAQGQRLLRSLREALGQASTQLQWGSDLARHHWCNGTVCGSAGYGLGHSPCARNAGGQRSGRYRSACRACG